MDVYKLTRLDLKTEENLGPNLMGCDLERLKEQAMDWATGGLFEISETELVVYKFGLREQDLTKVWVVSECQHPRCKVIVAFEPLYDEGGYCASCLEVFCRDHIDDLCGCSDDGSGQYVEDLPDFMCESCHEAYHEPPEY